MINIHPSARISKFADIEDSTKGTVTSIGEGSVIDIFVKIKPAGGSGDVIIGEWCHINSGCVLYSGNGITLGKHVLIAANCTLAPVNHSYNDLQKMIFEQGFMASKGGIVIEDDVWIGANSVILDGTTIKSGVIVAAGSVVKGVLKNYGIYAGTPAKLIKFRSEEEER